MSTQSSTVESVTSGGAGDWSSSDDDYGDYYGGDGDMSYRMSLNPGLPTTSE